MPARISQIGETRMLLTANPDYWKRAMGAWQMEVASNDIQPVGRVFDLKSGARARLADRSDSMAIIEGEKYRSDWIEWSEVKSRIAAK
jgi:hypothetical protein